MRVPVCGGCPCSANMVPMKQFDQKSLMSLGGAALCAIVLIALLAGVPRDAETKGADDPLSSLSSQDIAALQDQRATGQAADSLTIEQLVALASTAPRPAKLADATETVDDNGIVHGTTASGINYTVRGRGVQAAAADRITLAAVGDQVASDNALYLADGNAGEYNDGLYDFNPWYEEAGPVIRERDLRFINQETIMAVGDEIGGPSGYPSFNTPDAAAQAIADQGFNLVNFATNHIYDYWLRGIEISHEVWQRYPQLVVAGSYLSQEARETVQLIERNGTTFAFLSYAYGDNRFTTGEWTVPNSYYDCFFDERLMAADIARAREVADVVIVGMHWGTEYEPEPNAQQRQWAQWLADQQVDLVLGTHNHSIQPVEYYKGQAGNIVPVVFGLSDFISGWEKTDAILSGIFSCDFVPDGQGGVKVGNLLWIPTIEWSDNERTYVRLLKGMTPQQVDANTRCVDVNDVYNHLVELVGSVITQVAVDWDAVEQDPTVLADAAAGKLAPGREVAEAARQQAENEAAGEGADEDGGAGSNGEAAADTLANGTAAQDGATDYAAYDEGYDYPY